ncbi:MAG: YciI family protein [Aeromicrobium sp.]
MSNKYLVLIRGGDWIPENVDENGAAIMSKAHKDFAEAVIAAGAQVIGGDALQPSSVGAIITPSTNGGSAVFTDGPFTESKEIISGFYMLEVETPEKARELAALCPTDGTLEFRPVVEFSG